MIKKQFLFLLVAILTLLLSTSILNTFVYAEENELSNVNLSKTEIVNHDYFAAGNTVNISGIVNGDAYVAGGNVTMDGTINGDLLTAGGNVTILGKVTGDVRAAGGNIIFSSDVGRNATIVGGSISMTESGKVNGSLVAAGGNLSINSPIGKEINVAAAQLNLGNTIGSDVNAYTSNINLTSSSKINGDLNYWSEKEVLINPDASISGRTNYHYVQTPQYNGKQARDLAGNSGKILGLVTIGSMMFYLYSFVVSLVIGLLLIKLLPIFTAGTISTLETHPWVSLGIGFLTILLFPLTFIILLITIIGIPLAFVMLMALIVLWFTSEIFVALFIGTKILTYFRNEKSLKGWSLFIGLLFIGILSLVPIINVLVGMFTLLFGIGALLIQIKNSYTLLHQKKLI